MKSVYITTPIYYVNDKPHIGHAYTSLACDVLARFKKLSGDHVYLLTGTDEHGQKIEQSAQKNNISPQELVDKFSSNFKELLENININNSDFIRTTQQHHKQGAIAFWQLLEEKNAIYLDKYAGWYAVRDEAFYTKEQVEERTGIKVAKTTAAPVEWLEEESYFFKLSDYQEKLLNFYADNPNFVAPKSRFNEVKSFVKSGLRDISISRTSFQWGIRVPNTDNHIMYVWIDALANYISALGFPDKENELFRDFWLNPETHILHMVGKDILIFHAVYWPAFLMAAELPLPKRIFAHGWWTNNGEKISKSIGNVIDPTMLIEKYGLDATRFFLMREVSFGQDGNFSHQAMIRRNNSDLANDFGNLCQRSLTMIAKNCDCKISILGQTPEDIVLLEQAYALFEKMAQHFDEQAFHLALADFFNLVGDANRYIDIMAPWELKKTDFARMEAVLTTIAEVLRILALLLQPFTPDSANKILDILNVPQNQRMFCAIANNPLQAGHLIHPPTIIFPRLEGEI